MITFHSNCNVITVEFLICNLDRPLTILKIISCRSKMYGEKFFRQPQLGDGMCWFFLLVFATLSSDRFDTPDNITAVCNKDLQNHLNQLEPTQWHQQLTREEMPYQVFVGDQIMHAKLSSVFNTHQKGLNALCGKCCVLRQLLCYVLIKTIIMTFKLLLFISSWLGLPEATRNENSWTWSNYQ